MIKTAKILALALGLFILSTGASLAEDKMKTYGDAFVGQKGEQVELVYFDGKDEALLVVRGVNHPWDGKAIKTGIRPGGTGKDYFVQHDGADYVTLVTRGNSGWETVELHLPDYEETIRLTHTGREDVRPLHILTQYKQEQETKPAE